MNPIIACLGDINADLSFEIAQFPREGDDIPARAVRWGGGGAALNMAVGVAHLAATARLIGRVGRDQSATIALAPARAAGVILDAVQIDDHHATGVCLALVTPNSQRSFVTQRGANVALSLAASLPLALSGADLLMVSAYSLLETLQRQTAFRAIATAQHLDIPVLLDLCLPAARERLAEIIELLDQLWLLSLNEAELQALLPGRTSQQALDELLAAGVQCVALKRGASGCTVAHHDGLRIDVLPPAVLAVDSNGCGDAFSAGLAVALLRGADLAQAATIANLMGALTATRTGAAEAIPHHDELLEWITPSQSALIGYPL